MNTKFNKWFEEVAADPARRRAAIAGFTKQRSVVLSSAVVTTGGAATMLILSTHNPTAAILLGFCAIASWFIFFRVDSHRRVLTLLDRLYKEREEKTAA